MLSYKRFYGSFYLEVIGENKFLGFTLKRKTRSEWYEYSFITKTLEEAEKKFEDAQIRMYARFAEKLIQTYEKKRKYCFWNDDLGYEKFHKILSVKKMTDGLFQEVDFANASVEEAFKNLTVEQFKETWGANFPK